MVKVFILKKYIAKETRELNASVIDNTVFFFIIGNVIVTLVTVGENKKKGQDFSRVFFLSFRVNASSITCLSQKILK